MKDRERIFKYITELGKILQDTVQNSKEIEEILSKLREEGVGLSLNFVAMLSGKSVNFNLGQVPLAPRDKDLKFEISDEDKKFLQSLGISYD